MAFEDAEIGIFPSSTGSGAIVTIYDGDSTRAQIRAPAYTNLAVRNALTPAKRRLYDALVDTVKKQASTLAGGVACIAIGSDGGGSPHRLAVTGSYPNEVIAGGAGS